MGEVVHKMEGKTVETNNDAIMRNCMNEKDFIHSVMWKEKYQEVKSYLKGYNLFSEELINSNVDFYFDKLGFSSYHFEETSSKIISKIIVCIITAKINQLYFSDTYFPIFEEKEDNIIFVIARVFAEDNKTRLNYKTEKKIEEKYFFFNDLSKNCYRLKSFRSFYSLFDQGEEGHKEPLRIYILELPTYEDGEIQKNEKDIRKLMDVNFYQSIKNTDSEQICYDLNKAVLNDLTGQFIQVHYCQTSEETFKLSIAVKRSNVISNFFSLVGDCLNVHRCFSISKYVEPLKNGVLIIILNVMLAANGNSNPASKEHMTEPMKREKQQVLEATANRIINSLKTLYLFRSPQFIHLTVKRTFTTEETAYIYVVSKFISFFSAHSYSSYKNVEHALNLKSNANSAIMNDFYIIKEKLKSSKYAESEILKCAQSNVETVKLLFNNFKRKFKKTTLKQTKGVSLQSEMDVDKYEKGDEIKNSKEIVSRIEDNYHKKILQHFYTFEKYVVKTNFFLTHKIGFAVAFDGALLEESIYEAQPYSIIMILGASYVGFHIRFSKMSRGGVRIVISNNINAYTHNYENLFDEAYNLSYTQNFKNKDIPEGGSKGIILLNADICHSPIVTFMKNLCFYSYVNSILDLLTQDQETCANEQGQVQNDKELAKNSSNNKNITDQDACSILLKEAFLREEKEEDLIFLGPDENTGCDKLMDWGAMMAKKRNYKYWKTFTTGKLRKNGGVPHDYYGMTTLGIETYVKKLCEKLNLKEEDICRSLVGGPDGDLGSNCILQSKTKIISVIDGSGVLYDKKGLNKQELIRLANIRKYGAPSEENGKTGKKTSNNKTCAMLYDEKYLSEEGFKVSIEQSNVEVLGKLIKNGLDFRNTFFLNELNKCDLFNPCGGRPQSINIYNVNSILKDDKCIYKYIIEGANVFISDDARAILEKKNVILFKDASTNKGGVISSSLEVLAGLVLEDEQYLQLMCSPNTELKVEEEKLVKLFKYDRTTATSNESVNSTSGCNHKGSNSVMADKNKKKEVATENEKEEVGIVNADASCEEEEKKEEEEEEEEGTTAFYIQYVKEIQEKIKYYCELEFEALWNETRRIKMPICEATTILSQKISILKKEIINSNTLCFDYKLMKKVIEGVIPPILLQKVSFDQIVKKVPFIYLKHLFAAALASKYYYSQEFLSDISVFNFFEFVKNLQKD